MKPKRTLQCQFADLGVKATHVDRRSGIFLQAVVEDANRALQQRAFPLFDLVGLQVELLHQITYGLLALIAASPTFALNAGL